MLNKDKLVLMLTDSFLFCSEITRKLISDTASDIIEQHNDSLSIQDKFWSSLTEEEKSELLECSLSYMSGEMSVPPPLLKKLEELLND